MNKFFLVVLAFFAQSAWAAEYDTYAGISINYLDVQRAGNSADVWAATAKMGAVITPYVSAEVRATAGLGSDSTGEGLTRVTTEVSSLVGAYLVVGMANNSDVFPYFVIGASRNRIAYEGVGLTTTESSDVAVGAGLDIKLGRKTDLTLEYVDYFRHGGNSLKGGGAGLVWWF